jgi:hypothetical protein
MDVQTARSLQCESGERRVGGLPSATFTVDVGWQGWTWTWRREGHLCRPQFDIFHFPFFSPFRHSPSALSSLPPARTRLQIRTRTYPMEPAFATLRRAAPRRQAPRSLYQCLYLHTTAARRFATPLPTPSVPGPPPDAPTPQSEAHDRVVRKRKQAELLRQAREIRASPSTKPNSILRKRFWKDVTVKESEGAYI